MTGSNPNSKNCERRPRTKLSRIADQVVHCKACSRLVEYRQKIAHQRKRAFKDWTYWGRPVPSFGDPRAEFVIIGLAPAAHGANRTGRMFTGDSSGSVVAYYPPSKSYVYQPPLERCVYQPPPKEYYDQPAPQHYVVQPPPEYVYYPPPVTYVVPSPVQKRFYQPPAQAYVVQPPHQQYLYQPPLQEYGVQAPPKTYMYYPPPRRLSLPP